MHGEYILPLSMPVIPNLGSLDLAEDLLAGTAPSPYSTYPREEEKKGESAHILLLVTETVRGGIRWRSPGGRFRLPNTPLVSQEMRTERTQFGTRLDGRNEDKSEAFKVGIRNVDSLSYACTVARSGPYWSFENATVYIRGLREGMIYLRRAIDKKRTRRVG